MGRELREQVYYLEELLEAYRDGTLREEKASERHSQAHAFCRRICLGHPENA